MLFAHIRLFCGKYAVSAQSKSSKLLNIRNLCCLLKVIQLFYLRHLCLIPAGRRMFTIKMFHARCV